MEAKRSCPQRYFGHTSLQRQTALLHLIYEDCLKNPADFVPKHLCSRTQALLPTPGPCSINYPLPPEPPISPSSLATPLWPPNTPQLYPVSPHPHEPHSRPEQSWAESKVLSGWKRDLELQQTWQETRLDGRWLQKGGRSLTTEKQPSFSPVSNVSPLCLNKSLTDLNSLGH